MLGYVLKFTALLFPKYNTTCNSLMYISRGYNVGLYHTSVMKFVLHCNRISCGYELLVLLWIQEGERPMYWSTNMTVPVLLRCVVYAWKVFLSVFGWLYFALQISQITRVFPCLLISRNLQDCYFSSGKLREQIFLREVIIRLALRLFLTCPKLI